jgi:hypothetical protein
MLLLAHRDEGGVVSTVSRPAWKRTGLFGHQKNAKAQTSGRGRDDQNRARLVYSEPGMTFETTKI